jgi:hypothetical protein
MPGPVVPPAETFDQAVARIAALPRVLTARVSPIALDLTPTGMLTRLLDLAADAQKRGDITAQTLQEIDAAVATLKGALAKIDETKLTRGVPVASLPGLPR